MNNKNKLLIIIILLLSLFIFLKNNQRLSVTSITTNKITYYSNNESEENYEIQEVKMFAIDLKVKGDYKKNIKSSPMTCKTKIERLTKLIYMDGDEKLGEKYVIYKDPVGELMNPTKKGYNFDSWTNKDGETVNEQTIVDSTVDYILYANWNIIISELTVDPNGGIWNESIGNQSFNMEFASTKEIEDPVRIGYTFNNWQVTGSDSSIKDKIFTMGIENSELKAIYNANKYKLTIDPAGGTFEGRTSKTVKTIEYDSTTTIEKPQRTGYTFTGWEVSNGTLNGDKFFMDYTGDVELKATWVVNQYKYIVYHRQQSRDGSAFNIVPNDTENGSRDYGTIINPNTKNYTGFITPSKQQLTIQDDTDPPVKNIINYNYNRYLRNLTVNPNGGTWNGRSSISTIPLYYEQTHNISQPSRTGYTFTGWSKTNNNSTLNGTVFQMGLYNTDLTANWRAKQYTLTYYRNGGSQPVKNGNTINSQTVTYDQPYGTLATTSRTGYRFQGWYTSPSGGSQITSSTVHKSESNIAVYAHWYNSPPTINNVTVRYHNNNSTTNGLYRNGYETFTLTIPASDYEDGTPQVSIQMGNQNMLRNASIISTQRINNSFVYTIRVYKMGAGTIKITATDRAGAKAETIQIINVYGEGGKITNTGQYTNTDYDSGWLEILEGCYISSYEFNVQFSWGHYNSSNNDSMEVLGETASGRVVRLYRWSGNMQESLHSSSNYDLNLQNQTGDKVVRIKFHTYSPHVSCARDASISYSVTYDFDINLMK